AAAAFRRRRPSADGTDSTAAPGGAEPEEPAEPERVIGTSPKRINDRFRRLQILSATYMALSHGSNDAQKTMGIMTLALFSAGAIHDKTVPVWVILLAATAMSLGTAAGGWRIMKTMGQRVVKLDPVHGFAAETTAASIILGASHFGMPVSTTHVISSAIMGVGASDRVHAVHWAVARSIVTAWILTIPCAAAIAAISYLGLHLSSGLVASALHVFGV
ncbi:MAG: anion permease, partial [Candidatus Limnocylindrales bacterium]